MKKIPYRYTDYKYLIENNCYYVDKTMYIEKLERNNNTIIYLRPRRFGKTLFASMLYYYYDINAKGYYDHLFKDTYIYKHSSKTHNSYYVLRFDFSKINSDLDPNKLEVNFNDCVMESIKSFLDRYNIKMNLDYDKPAATVINSLLSRLMDKYPVYIIIDEYDNFTNSLLKEDAIVFKKILSKDGFVRTFYSVLKSFMGQSLKKIFITGVCSVSLDSMTSGFNIGTNITNNINYNSMTALTYDEVKALVNYYNLNENIFNIMKINYDGYKFNGDIKEKVFNPNLVMYFLSQYLENNKVPHNLLDSNIYSDYNQMENILKLFNNNLYQEIIKNILENKYVTGILQENFTLSENLFNKNYLVSLLYYFGFLTIDSYNKGSNTNLVYVIPNKVIEKIFINYFMDKINNTPIDQDNVDEISVDLDNGHINKLVNYASKILEKLSYRDLEKFDEKYIKLIYFAVLTNVNMYNTYSEYEVNNGYIDLYTKGKNNYIFEFKYIKKNNYSDNLLNKKELEAKEQLINYSKDNRLKNTKKYIIIYSGKDLKRCYKLPIEK